MAESSTDQSSLVELITPSTTEEEFRLIIGKLLTHEDITILGPEATQKVADSIAYFGSYAPEPAHFNKEAFWVINTLGLPPQERERLLEINKRMGVIKDRPDVGEGRMSISQEVVDIGRQFLTD